VNNKTILKIIVISLIVIGFVAAGITYRNVGVKKQQQRAYLLGGFSKEQAAGLQKELEYISPEHDYVDRGYAYLKEGKVEDAIKQFNTVLERGKKTAALGDAREGLVDAYEKARDYKTAADLLEKIMSSYVLAKGDKWRLADDERLLYLRYAANGEYYLAVERAQKSLEADAQLPNRPQGANPSYYQRLNDLKAAKDYILSQKKN
jgi:tetratricopeptide (TPR) repeat protein